MDDHHQQSSPAPRRSQRDRKVVKPFVSAAHSAARKRKRANESDTEEDATPATRDKDQESDLTEDEDDDDEQDKNDENNDRDDDADDEDVPIKTPKRNASSRKGKAKAQTKPKGTPTPKKPRVEKANATPTAPKPTATGGTRRGRKPKDTTEVAYNAEQVAKDTRVAADNPLFNAIMNPTSALQSSVEDFLQSLQQSPGAAMAELVNLILRSCGCNDSVDSDQALDIDGVASNLGDLTEALKMENSPTYPLTSKLPVFKRFRKSLSEWIERLITSAADMGLLYRSPMMEVLQPWVASMSSSLIRSFRHTATVVALESETALCDVAAGIEKELEVVNRQRDGERKRKGPKGTNERLKELEKKAKEIKTRQEKVKAFIAQFFDGVFVHRYRDLDPSIRAECVQSLGLWLKKHPSHFLTTPNLSYIGHLLSDTTTSVRLAAVRAVAKVYELDTFIPSMNIFTSKFKGRILSMAKSDTEMSVRVAVVLVLGAMDAHGLLEEEEREDMCLLLFDEEPKIRKAVCAFVKGEWEEGVNDALERMEGGGEGEKDKERVGVKVFARLLVRWCKRLDSILDEADESEMGDVAPGRASSVPTGIDEPEPDVAARAAARRAARRREVLSLITGSEDKTRISLAVDAIWGEVAVVGNWEAILDILLLDHSPEDEDHAMLGGLSAAVLNGTKGKSKGAAAGKKGKGRGRAGDDFVVDEAWRLEEDEETVLLEVLVASIRRTRTDSVGGKKGEEENVSNDITRALIKGLPRLFVKYQTDQKRITDVLALPTLMNLDLYLEMRMITAYTSLWDDVIKQFLSHSSLPVLKRSISTIQHLLTASTSLSNSNSSKILELEDELSTQLRDIVAGRDEIEVASFTEDEVVALTGWCTRFCVLIGRRNMAAWIEEDEGGKQSAAWDIVSALVERGRLGYKEEECMVEQALHILDLYIYWKTKGLPAAADQAPEDEAYREHLKTQRESLLEKLVEYAVGTQSNTVEGVKRAAFKHLLDLYVLFSPNQTHLADGTPLPHSSLSLTLEDELQYRCTGYIQAEIERYAEFLDDEEQAEEDEEEDDDDEDNSSAIDGDDDAESSEKARKRQEKLAKKAKKASQKAKKDAHEDLTSRDLLEKEYLFIEVISTFLRAIKVGAVHLKHGAVLLAHYGRLDAAFDSCAKWVVDSLREEDVMKNDTALIVSVITESVQEAFTLVLDGLVRTENNAVSLAKLLSTCFIVRGPQLAILRRLHHDCIVQIQTDLIAWIVKKLAGYEKSKNKKGLKAALGFFKVLVPLVGPISTREALKIKAYLDQTLEEAKIEVPAAKLWDPIRAYEKRLSAIMAKDNPQAPKKARKSKKDGGKGGASSEEETDLEGERTAGEDEGTTKAKPRPKPRRVTRANPVVDEDAAEQDPTTPKASRTRRGRAAAIEGDEEEARERSRSPSASRSMRRRSSSPSNNPPSLSQVSTPLSEPSLDEEPQEEPEEQAQEEEPVTPRSSRKRPRSDVDEDEDEGKMTNGSAGGGDEDGDSMSGTPDIVVKRKRVRH